ncbi:histidine kinase [Ectothiorhodospiraceae bacterium BW-2]|nr:histidine kinase [Ectothiorhodospiraceae bacterium BW-2]
MLIATTLLTLTMLWQTVRLIEELILPSEQFHHWSEQIRQGNTTARLPAKSMGALHAGAAHVNRMMQHVDQVSLDLESAVKKQTAQFEQKTKSLQLLYDVATSINTARDTSDLLTRFLHTMRNMINAKAGMVRLIHDNGKMEIVSSFGIDKQTLQNEQQLAIDHCLCGSVSRSGEPGVEHDLNNCQRILGSPILNNQGNKMIAVPLQYHGRALGIYNLFIDPDKGVEFDSEISALFSSVGQHLGMAIEKARLDDESKRLSIMKERNALAHELHDSLAQTLASLRFQISMLDDSVNHIALADIHHEIQQIKGGLDEAYSELRELLAHFRAPMHKRGLMPALEDLISNFRTQTQMRVLLQREWNDAKLPANMELQILRIVQESLANIRKHSQAHTVRVLLRSHNQSDYTVLIEDDGIGIDLNNISDHPGENLGLSIMQERARYLGGELKIESEPGEGTRIHLFFTTHKYSQIQNNQHFALI